MGFLRRLIGGGPPTAAGDGASGSDGGPATEWSDDDERAHELELARFEQDRTTDLMRRQQRYSDRSWTPPTQGGSRRAGGKEAVSDDGS